MPHPEPTAPGRVKHDEPAPSGSALALKRTPLAPRYWTFRDLDIGATVQLYNRKYTLTDADQFTKEFYTETLGSPLQPAQMAPADPYVQNRKQYIRTGDEAGRPPNRRRDAFTKYMETKMGVAGTRSGDDPVKISKYIQHQGRVLRFYGTWDDKNLFGRKHRLVIHYFLCDDTIEVVEKLGRNSGCDSSASGKEALMLKRGVLPRNPKMCMNVPGGYAPRPSGRTGGTSGLVALSEAVTGDQVGDPLSEFLYCLLSNNPRARLRFVGVGPLSCCTRWRRSSSRRPTTSAPSSAPSTVRPRS